MGLTSLPPFWTMSLNILFFFWRSPLSDIVTYWVAHVLTPAKNKWFSPKWGGIWDLDGISHHNICVHSSPTIWYIWERILSWSWHWYYYILFRQSYLPDITQYYITIHIVVSARYYTVLHYNTYCTTIVLNSNICKVL